MSATYILILGLPGSGKGTLAQNLVSQFKCSHISCGDVFRNEIKLQTAFGINALKYIKNGQLTPDEETSRMFLSHLCAEPDAGDYLIEGYPRTIAQAQDFDRHIRQTHRSLGSVIYLEVGRDELLRRIIGRRICNSCGAIYNLVTKPPLKAGICDVDGGLLIHRPDDAAGVALSRVILYEEKERAVMGYFKEKLQCVNAEAPPAVVLGRIGAILGRFLKKGTQ